MTNISKGTYFFAIFLIVASEVYLEKLEIRCPEFCECDVFENLRRATCKHKRLVSIDLNIPSQAQILDVSDNQISELGDKIFLELHLTNLKLLNISHNKVKNIHFNGFEGLEDLKTLDLSYNAIQYFTQAWFDSLSSLQELYLRGNKLKSINDEPLIDIKTLRVLDLSNCGIIHLNPKVFTMIPNLEILDISGNFLQRLKVEVIQPLTKLTLFKAHDNNFNCKDRGLIAVKNYIRQERISYKDPCIIDTQTSFTVNSWGQKFEKMVMSPVVEFTTVTQQKNFWIFDDTEINNTKIIEICSNGTKKESGSNLEGRNEKTMLMHMIELSPFMVLSITFVYGVLSGMVITCLINLCIRRKKLRIRETIDVTNGNNSQSSYIQSLSSLVARRDRRNRTNSVLYTTLNKARRQLSRDDNISDDEGDNVLVMNEFDLAQSTPMQERKTYA